MTSTDDIRAAFAAIVDEAPAPERIRAGLAQRVRRHRQRRLVLRFAAVAAAAAGVAGLGSRALLSQPDTADFPEIAGGPGGGWLSVPLRYRPGWLPAGYGQATRSVLVVGDRAPVVCRDWRPSVAPEGPTVSLLVGWHESIEPDRPTGRSERVDVDGVPGTLVVPPGPPMAHVLWQPPGAPQLLVTANLETGDADDAAAAALRVARSTSADAHRTWVGPRFGWLPDGLAAQPWRCYLGHDGATWIQSMVTTDPSGQHLLISMGPHMNRPGFNEHDAEPITVRGLAGWQMPAHNRLFLTLPDGIEVVFNLSTSPGDRQMADVVRVAETLDFGPWPDMSWVGTR
jgi:hypothetical protein